MTDDFSIWFRVWVASITLLTACQMWQIFDLYEEIETLQHQVKQIEMKIIKEENKEENKEEL